jgi:hypothetical protein
MGFFETTMGFLRFRYSEPQLVRPGETPGSSMSRRVFFAEAKDILGSREKRGVTADGLLEAANAAAEAPQGQGATAQSNDAQGAEAAKDRWTPPVDANLLGLALSGGGIRSATFCLGALQVLGERGVLRHVDYLSTVSGGGYIGSFWTCFLAKSKVGGELLADVTKVDERGVESKPFQQNPLFKLQHVKGREESDTFQRLRNYANYLMVGGLWGAIRGPAVVLRGLIINFLMVLPYVLLVSALVAWLFKGQIGAGTRAWATAPGLPLWGWALGIAFVVAVVLSTVLQSMRRRGGRSSAASRKWLFGINMAVVLAALAVVWIDLQPKLIHALFCIPGKSTNCALRETGTWAFLFDGEFWSAVSAALGTVSAVVAGLTASRASAIKAKVALAAVAILVPLSFLFLHFLLSAWAVFGLPEWLGLTATPAQYGLTLQAYLIAAVVLLVVSGVFFDVNATSLHNFYRDSLSRTFLFSLQDDGNGKQTQREDDLGLGEVDIKKSGGPYHLINATVNNPDLKEEGLRGRRSDFFVFGPEYSGGNRLGYCSTRRLEHADKGANLGTALAVSAGALAPNMGEKTKPLLTFLLAMLNLRLGYWLPSPTAATAKENAWLKPIGPFYFFAEMLGLGSSKSRYSYVNLSDGGHIENLGIFELLRRRCKYIVAIDSEADPGLTFNGLATLIRLARTDMGIDIDIDVEDLRKDAEGLSRRHWVLGRIDYGGEQYGELLYVKSSLTGSENEYITEYRSRNPDFPHQTTSDQFFDEVQFEAYRALGYRVGNSVFPTAVDPKSMPDDIFAMLRERDTGTVRRHDAYFDLLDRRRSIDKLLADPALYSYAREIVPELDAKGSVAEDARAPAEIQEPPSFKLHQVCNEQLQLMERALLALRLDDPRNRGRRSNRGWMNLFRRWGQAETFQRMWAANIANYSSALQDFCHEDLGLSLRAEWQAGPTGLGPEAATRHLIAALSAIHRDGRESPRFPVAEATVQRREDGETLTGFDLRAPYSGVGLRELLFRELGKDEIWHGSPTFDLGGTDSSDREATVRALVRCHFRPSA